MIHSLFTAQHLTVQTGRLRPGEGGTSEQDYAWAQWQYRLPGGRALPGLPDFVCWCVCVCVCV